MSRPYDAVLVVSFGGPEGIDDVMPFLENVLRGRNVPRERMLAVAKHYELFGGVSPINAQNRKLIAALNRELEAKGPRLPIYFGNRNWHPLLADTLSKMRDDGAFYNHPCFIEANVANLQTALKQIPQQQRSQTRIVFTAHSIPQSMAKNCDYEVQLRETSRLIAETAGIEHWQLVFQSRSGSPSRPWLGPDICDHLRELQTSGAKHVVVAPIGFVSDHMEIIYDLDIEARAVSQQLGLNMIRSATAGSHPSFIEMIRELIMERVDPETPRRSLGTHGPRDDFCAPGCCSLV